MKNLENDIRAKQHFLFKFVLIPTGIGALVGTPVAAVLLLTNTLNLWSLIISTDYVLMELVALVLASIFLFAPRATFTAVTFVLSNAE